MTIKSKYNTGPKKATPEQINQAVKRYLEGEQVVALAKEYKISVPGFYLWIKRAREAAAAQAALVDISPKQQEKDQAISLRLRVDKLQQENDQLKKKLFELMLKHGEI
jgi:transposase-like protein